MKTPIYVRLTIFGRRRVIQCYPSHITLARIEERHGKQGDWWRFPMGQLIGMFGENEDGTPYFASKFYFALPADSDSASPPTS